MSNETNRLRRATKTRAKIRKLGIHRLTVYRTPRHIYAQINTGDGSKTLVSASTVEGAIREDLQITGNIQAAVAVGKSIAEKALASGIKEVAFDRAGYKFHGRVKALADAAREDGLKF